MRRRAKTGSNAVKTQRRKTLSRRNAPKSARNDRSSAARQETEVARLTRELHEAREQQAATSEVLGVISSSPGELGPVFEAILENATRICDGRLANLFLYSKHEHAFRLAAQRNAPAAYAERWAKNPVLRIGENPRNPLARLAKTKRVVAIPDLMVEPGYINREPRFVALVESAGARTHVLIPMLKEGELIGGIAVYRQEVLPFTDRQIELLRNFAAQAVIAIENTRLLNELRESLQQQTATSEVLSVISSSPGELEPVFKAMLANATDICEAKFGFLWLAEGDGFRAVAMHGVPSALAEERHYEGVIHFSPDVPLGRVALTKQLVHVADIRDEPGYAKGFRPIVRLADAGGARTLVAVPMHKDNDLVGAIIIYRQEVRPFTDKQIELVKNFAAQAVIAIENTRLLNELRESLQQQTATADVLKVISSSPGDLKPVFEAMLENAVRLCAAKFGSLVLFEGNAYRRVALHNAPAVFVETQAREPVRPLAASPTLSRLAKTRQTICYADILAEQPEEAIARLGGARTVMAVPMLKDDRAVGAISIYRQEVRPFTDKQMEVLRNFAAQAVIAIENTRLLNELRQRTDDLSDSLEQQTATSEVLKVISSSPGELDPVFQAILENATRICEAGFGLLHLSEGDSFRTVALHSVPQALAEHVRQRGSFRALAGTPLDRLLRARDVIYTADETTESNPGAPARLGGARSLVAVPMLKENKLIGAIVIYRQEVRPFTDKQIALLTNFAAQAVIAIENARLLNELRKRTDDLSDSLEQQTATSEVLKVISSSPGELQPVFEAMLENAVRICGAKFGTLFRYDGDIVHLAAQFGTPLALTEFQQKRGPFRSETARTGILGRVIRTKAVVHSADSAADPNPGVATTLGGARSIVGVPMFKNDALVGAIVIYRQEVRPFTDKQIELVKNFAAQAVIAIENTRLLNELRESLQQQIATADVLKVISTSPGELEPVFNAMLENATRVCDAEFGTLYLRETDSFRAVAIHNGPPAYVQARKGNLVQPPPDSALGQVMTTHKVAQIDDAKKTKSYIEGNPYAVSAVELGGYRTIAAVPMLKHDELVGAILIYRQEVRSFSEKQIALLENFAAQAIIAIENTRLLNELRESLQQQTATADVLKVISRSTFDLQSVLDTLVKSAARLCRAEKGNVALLRGDTIEYIAQDGFPADFLEYMKALRLKVQRGSVSGRAVLEGTLVHVPDVLADPEFVLLDAQKVGGFRTALGVPLMREGVPIGTMFLARAMVEPFTQQQIDLVSTFADQAVIAIENVRLFESVEARTRELAKSLDDLRTTQDRLVQTQKLASLGQLTAGIAHEIKNPLNFVNNFSVVSAELIEELQEALKDVSLNEKRRSEITELMETLRGNLDKIVQHGKRADAIVKNMLLHSREGSGEHRLVDINALVEEGLNLAYHGARAEKQGFNITLEKFLDPAVGEADVFPQDITRVLLNLISNGFYAATKRKAQSNNDAYEPTLAASTRNLGDHVEICIRDNGTGIPPDVKERIFNPFFTTKPAGEGTGLGLSISHDIIVKQHGGSIEVDTQPGESTEFRIILPRRAATIAKP